MHDAFLVRRLQGVGNLARDGESLVARERSACDALGQCVALNEFHDERGGPVRVHTVDLRDVRVIERGHSARLAFEAHQPLGIKGEPIRHDLEGNVSVQRRVTGAVHLAHTADSDDGDDLMSANASAGCERHGR
jgi:hypothetical protein